MFKAVAKAGTLDVWATWIATGLCLSACSETYSLGTHDARAAVVACEPGDCATGFKCCSCTGCTPEADTCSDSCLAPRAGCSYSGPAQCGACHEALSCPESCLGVSCPQGTECCACSGCLEVGTVCPNRPPWCDPVPDNCRVEGSTPCDCGRILCEGDCDILQGGECAAGSFCDFAAGCGADQMAGTCVSRPGNCPSACEQVCGCDDTTYCNQCLANMAGVDLQASGACN